MMGSNSVPADQLRLLIERIERLEEEKKGIADDIKDVYGEAKATGFDVKTMREIVKLRKMSSEQRREREAMIDLYRAALGMLDGTPLGNWAVERLNKGSPSAPPLSDDDAVQPAHQPDPMAEFTIDDARRMGLEAAQTGSPVTANPFPARDPRRASWDEAWCHELGSDGMDIPEALRPAAKGQPDPADADQVDDDVPVKHGKK